MKKMTILLSVFTLYPLTLLSMEEENIKKRYESFCPPTASELLISPAKKARTISTVTNPEAVFFLREENSETVEAKIEILNTKIEMLSAIQENPEIIEDINQLNGINGVIRSLGDFEANEYVREMIECLSNRIFLKFFDIHTQWFEKGHLLFGRMIRELAAIALKECMEEEVEQTNKLTQINKNLFTN